MQTGRRRGGRARKSLCPTFKKLKTDLDSVDMSSVVSDLSNQSDLEWEQLQSKIHATNDIMEIANSALEKGIDVLGNDENLPIYSNMNLQVEAKQREADRVRKIALEMQDRFVWDLSLAIKKDLVFQNRKDSAKEAGIAIVGIRDIVHNMQDDPCCPDEWKEYITNELTKRPTRENTF
ncbi:hypothetical protein TRFO_42572 [Tritrichomonas foetus]|uniref:Uncharacterized protein n=1 Tax=Tritrichomonas foetus TaxID=1144522 RepID=A0A1J4KWU2_9EUKA|nr:hypothetical protein TRFO_42572 [Tritrichomonas foetus]|eukprot:OHT15344.1 hypothetical protein TRFO_42572 [Tritrichomonas foetus]